MSEKNIQVKSVQLESAKIIHCMLPDDGTDIKLMRQLKKDKGITRVESIAWSGVNNLQQAKTRAGKLPEPTFYRLVSVIVTDEKADDVFDFIYRNAQIGQPGGGVLLQTTLLGATTYSMPDDVDDEES